MWAQSLALRGLHMGIQICSPAGRQWEGPHPGASALPSCAQLKSKGNSFQIGFIELQPFSSFTSCLFHLGDTFYMITAKGQYDRTNAHIACFAHWGNVGEAVSIFEWPLLSYHMKVHLKSNTGGKMYPHCKLFYEKMFAVYTVRLLGRLKT